MFLVTLFVRLLRAVPAVLAGIFFPAVLTAQVSLTGGTYSQNFDSTPAVVPAGWAFSETGANANTAFGTGSGTSNTGDTYFLGTSGEWAFGGLQSSSLIPTIGVAFTNNTGGTITALQVAYTGETWRAGTITRTDRLDFQYSLNATSLTSGSWTDVDALDYTNAGHPTVGGGSLLHSASISATITGLSIAPGATIHLRWLDVNVSGADDAMGVDNFSVTPTVTGGGAPPVIGTHPANASVTAGDTAQFSVSASGSGTLSYQWRKGGANLSDAGNISGVTTATLSIANAQAADQGSYDVVVTNTAGSATSNPATLTVLTPIAPSITTQPAPKSAFVGGIVTFNVTATGTAPLSYQWYRNGSPVTVAHASGATSATLTLSGVQLGDAGTYTVVVSNSAGSDTSTGAALTVATLDLYWRLSAGDFAQDWSDAGMITANDNWSGVPSIIGYLGQDITTSTGVDPQTLTGTSAAANDVDVIANQSNTNLTSGGVAEFDGIPNRTIALQGSGTADAPHLIIHLDTRGRSAVNVSYNLRDLDGSADNAAQAVALQYRIGATGPFVNVPAGYVADATDGPSIAGRVTPVSVLLPAAVDNQPKVQLRIMTTNAVGNDEWVGVDDILVTSVADGVPRVFFDETDDLTSVTEGGATDDYFIRLNTTPSAPVTLRVQADTQAEVSADGVTFGAFADLVFSDALPRAVTVRAVDDATNEAATHFSTITHAIIASGDPGYPVGLAVPALVAQVNDNDGGTGLTRIHAIQGPGAASPLAGFQVTINGVVTGFFAGTTGARDGFFVQEQDANADADPATSEGIYVFVGSTSSFAPAVAALNVGDLVTVTGRAVEFNGLTEVTDVLALAVDATGVALPAAVAVELPLPAAGHLERLEGMRVTLPQTLTVTDNFDLGRFGQIVLSHGRLSQPTNVAAPGAPAQAQLAANLLNQIVVDDGTSRSFPDPTPYLFDDGSGHTLRAGDTTTGVAGVLTYQFGLYMVQPSAAPVFTRDNPRPAAPPSVGGTLRVASGNVLNLFNGNGAGGGFPTSRGATNLAEYERQKAKLVAAILAIAPDIMGLVEMENDGFGPASALADLVNALNAGAPAGTTYAYVDASAVDIVTDLIHSVFIYRTETVETVGAPAMLSSPYFNNVARNPLAQTFRERATGGVLTVSINHFRAKASVSTVTDGIFPNPNADQGDGQGTNNYLRTKEADALVAWLATDPTGSGDPDFLILGDLNAYAQEDPITLIKGAGYVNLTEAFEGANGYSYSFDGAFGHLDHALATNGLAAQVTGTATWHVNSDEPIHLDYNLEDKSAAQQALNVGTPYRYSDHDPVIVGLTLQAPPLIVTPPAPQSVTVGQPATFSVVATGTPAPTYQWRRNGVTIPGAGSASFTISHAVTADAGDYDVVVTNSLGSVTSAPAALIVEKAVAGVFLGGLAAVYDGAAHPATVTTAPAGLNVVLTYDGTAAAPVNAGSYAVVATVVDADYLGSATGTLVISPAPASVVLGNLDQVYDGTARTVTATTAPAGLATSVTYDGAPEAPIAAGSYAVVATVTDPNHTGSATGTLNVAPAPVALVLGDLVQSYNGTPRPVSVTTTPAGLPVTVTYDAGPTPPTYPGVYGVSAQVTDPNYEATADETLVITITALVRRGPALSGALTGSLQVLQPDAVALSGTAAVSGDLLLPGTPEVRLNGKPTFGGTIEATGAAAPVGHLVTLNGNASLRHVVRRVDSIGLPAVSAPPAPAGTRQVTLNSSGENPGDWATLRDLTLGGNAGTVEVPPGTYGALTANGKASFALGVPGATTPAVYNLQALKLNGTSRVVLVGPVTLNLAAGLVLSEPIGVAGNPDWLEVNLAAGGLTLNGNATFEGHVLAPAGAVTLNGKSQLHGGVMADQLVINGTAVVSEPQP